LTAPENFERRLPATWQVDEDEMQERWKYSENNFAE
jgi:hypothetical protein